MRVIVQQFRFHAALDIAIRNATSGPIARGVHVGAVHGVHAGAGTKIRGNAGNVVVLIAYQLTIGQALGSVKEVALTRDRVLDVISFGGGAIANEHGAVTGLAASHTGLEDAFVVMEGCH